MCVPAYAGQAVNQGANQQLLQAAEKLMGRAELAAGLKVPPETLDAWLDGQQVMPDSKLGPLSETLKRYAERK
jgi:hypothetical protein